MTVRGGKRPLNPPCIFPGSAKSCLKQVQSKKDLLKFLQPKSVDKAKLRQMKKEDKITIFQTFVREIKKKCSSLFVRGVDLTILRTDKMGRVIVVIVHFSEVVSPFGLFKFVTAARNGMEVSNQTLLVFHGIVWYQSGLWCARNH